MEIVKGWRFYSADFSINATDAIATGSVALKRCPRDAALWHQLPEEVTEGEDCPQLFVVGHGITLKDAIKDANKRARKAKPINTVEQEGGGE